MTLYEELGKIQFQLERFEQAKSNIKQQIEIQLAIEVLKPQEKVAETTGDKE